jgi:branched-chain amino acid transport system ATP-binding protein
MKNKKPILSAKDLSINFGGLKALDGFSLELKPKELVGLIGPNGAGKTTVFNVLTGVYQATSGSYVFDNQMVKNIDTYELVRMGLARTFQNIRLFNYLTVLENVMIPQNHMQKYGFLDGALRLPAYWKEENELKERSMELLKIFELEEYAYTSAGNLPYGQQRKLEIARAISTNPKVLLLDEPAAGMNPFETNELMETIKFIRDKFGVTILLIEHDMSFVLGICERIYVLNHGKTIAQGPPSGVINEPEVIEAYLGKRRS